MDKSYLYILFDLDGTLTDSIGVLWGYGSREELTEAGATCLVKTPADVERLVNKGTKQYIFEEKKNDDTRYADPNRKQNL